MNTKGSPPPYTTGADVPLTSQPNREYNPQPVHSPTFQPLPVTTTVNVSTARAKGSCPVCQGTSWTGSYSCCAWLLCIFCFPCGIICCCCMRQKKCTKCGFTIG